jgi:hypothetical protein
MELQAAGEITTRDEALDAARRIFGGDSADLTPA